MFRLRSQHDTSPISVIANHLETAVDGLVRGKHVGDGSYEKGYAAGLTKALSVLTCLSADEVKNEIMLSYEAKRKNSD